MGLEGVAIVTVARHSQPLKTGPPCRSMKNSEGRIAAMANLEVEFCGLRFKNPVVVASLETTNSPKLIRECVTPAPGG